MNKTLMAILSAGALLVARTALAQRPDPGAGYGHSNGPRPLGAPCQRGGDMGRGAWNGDGNLVAAHLDPWPGGSI